MGLLRPDEIQRIRTKYPDGLPKRPNRSKFRTPEYRSLRKAVLDPKLYSGRALFGSGLPPGTRFTFIAGVMSASPIQKNQWVRLAWLRKYQQFDIQMLALSNGRYYTVEEYIRESNENPEAEKMLKWWAELISLVPKGH